MSRRASPRPSIIIFDLDDTVIHQKATDTAVMNEVARAVGLRFPSDALANAVRDAARELWQQSGELPYCQCIGISATEGLAGDFSGDDPHLRALRAFVEEAGYPERVWGTALRGLRVDDRALARALATAYAEARRARNVQFPDALPALQSLAGSARLAMITNGAPRVQRPKIEGSGLAHFFDPAIVSGEFGRGKPDPAIFEHLLQRVGARADAALMVGDNPRTDILGAQAAGIRAVWINRTGEPCPPEIRPDATIATLAELLRMDW